MALLRVLTNALAALGGTRAGLNAQAAGGIEGEVLTSQIHGKYGARAKAGQLFIGSTTASGVTIPVNTSNVVSVFTLYNPLNSGVDLEIEKLSAGIVGTTTEVIGELFFAWQNTGASAALTSLTALANVNNARIGGASPKALAYSAATYTGTPAVLEHLGISFGTTAAAAGPDTVQLDIDGSIVVPPGYSITIVGNVAQTQPIAITIKWAEIPS